MSLKINFWIVLPLFLSLAGCATAPQVKENVTHVPALTQAVSQAASVFNTIPTGRTPVSQPSFQLLDDFAKGIGWNKVEAYWDTKGTYGSKIRVSEVEEDAVTEWGKSAALEFSLLAGEEVKFITPLNGFDLSKAETLSMLIREKELSETDANVSIQLIDALGQSKSVALRKFLVSERAPVVRDGWVEVSVPRASFGKIDFGQLEQFELVIDSRKELAGTLVVDEIGFYGAGNLVFESRRDNLMGFPTESGIGTRQKKLVQIADDETLLREIAVDTWRYFENLIDEESGLIVDHVRLGRHPGIGSYTSPTNVALFILSAVVAYDLSIISRERAVELIGKVMVSLKKLERWEGGHWYNFYQTHDLRPTRRYISSVDNGWLAAALVVLRQAFAKEFKADATQILDEIDFSKLYDEKNGQLRLGYDEDAQRYSSEHYGMLATEARIASYIAIGKGDIDETHWARIYRTLPRKWDWQNQTPFGLDAELFGVKVFEGHYKYLDRKFVPSWGGSLFEFLAPTLVVDEQKFAPESLGKNNEVATDIHIGYALRKKEYPIWGLAPCAIADGRGWGYREYGIPSLGAKGYADKGVIAPYASFLALEIRSRAVIKNIREMLENFEGVYGEYGFYDSVHAMRGTVNPQYLVLDQGMSLIAIANYLEEGGVRTLFHRDPVGQKVSEFLGKEVFAI